MISIKDDATLERVLRSFPDIQLSSLLRDRRSMLGNDWQFEELAHFIIVQEGDRLADIEREAGISITFDDGDPTWEWAEFHHHAQCWECPIIVSDDGFGVVLFIQKGDIDPTLQRLLGQCD